MTPQTEKTIHHQEQKLVRPEQVPELQRGFFLFEERKTLTGLLVTPETSQKLVHKEVDEHSLDDVEDDVEITYSRIQREAKSYILAFFHA